jgi:2-hydroxycyclohexanecarboxyl-CoA dehydrogenase
VVTGASGAIGSAIARELTDAGVRVVVCASTAAHARPVAEALEGAEAFGADLTDRDSVGRLVAEIHAAGPVDILVNCAGGSYPKPFAQTTPDDWDHILAFNLGHVIQLSHAFLPGMSERGWGRLVCIASDAGRIGSRGEAVYSAAKGGVIALCKTLAHEVARRGVTCNVISPGPVETQLLQAFRAHSPAQTEKLRKRIPIGRFAEPEEIAAAVGFLCSERAGYITGQVLSVNGGLAMP